jgi:hypothetical protein
VTGRQKILIDAAIFGVTIAIVISLFVFYEPGPMDITAGSHHLTVSLPRGFEVVEREDGVLLRKGLDVVAITDLGSRRPWLEDGLTFDGLIAHELPNLGFTFQQEVSRRDSLYMQDHVFMIIETWDRLTHDHPYRYAFAINNEALLVLHAGPGRSSGTAAAWDEIMRSITFRDP